MDDQQRARELAHKIGVYYTRKGSTALEDGFFGFTETELQAYAAALRAAPVWEPLDSAPRRDRVLVRCDSGSVYAAHWVQNPMTGNEAWLVCALEDGTQMLVHPVEWMPLPAADRPQGVK